MKSIGQIVIQLFQSHRVFLRSDFNRRLDSQSTQVPRKGHRCCGLANRAALERPAFEEVKFPKNLSAQHMHTLTGQGFLGASVDGELTAGCPTYSARSRCYWGAICFAISCGDVRNAARTEFSQPT